MNDLEPVVRVVGGHYVPGQAVVVDRVSGAQLRLEPRCGDRWLPELPGLPRDPIESLELEVTLRRGLVEPVVTVHPIEIGPGPLYVRLPMSQPDQHAVVILDAWSVDPSARPGSTRRHVARYRGQVDNQRPDEPLRLQPTIITFGWRSHCLYRPRGKAQCPRAKADGFPCRPAHDRDDALCRYTCEADEGGFDPWPPRILFATADGEDAWGSDLGTMGEILRGYVDGEHRFLELAFDAWLKRPPRRDRIDYVLVESPTGTTHRVRVGELDSRRRLRLHVPNVQCHDTFRQTIVGNRPYMTRPLYVARGRLELEHPSRAQRTLHGSGLLGLGINLARHPIETHRWNPRRVFVFEFAVAYRPWDSPLSFEAQFGYDLTEQPYVNRDGNAEAVAYSHFPLAFAAVWHVYQKHTMAIDIGGSTGVAVTAPFLFEDVHKVGLARVILPVFATFGRFQLARGVQAEIMFRLHPPTHESVSERYLQQADQESHVASDAARNRETVTSMTGILGLRWHPAFNR